MIEGSINEAVEKVLATKDTFEKDHMNILFNLKLLKVIKLIRANQIPESIVLAQK